MKALPQILLSCSAGLFLLTAGCSSIPPGAVKITPPDDLMGKWVPRLPDRPALTGPLIQGDRVMMEWPGEIFAGMEEDIVGSLGLRVTFTPTDYDAELLGMSAGKAPYTAWQLPDSQIYVKTGKEGMYLDRQAETLTMRGAVQNPLGRDKDIVMIRERKRPGRAGR